MPTANPVVNDALDANLNAFWIRIRFISLNRQQISTSRVTRVTPCATAANPPTKTNSTCDEINLRVSSLRFCISLLHRGVQRLRKIQRIIIRLHPFPRCFCQTILSAMTNQCRPLQSTSSRRMLPSTSFLCCQPSAISLSVCECKCCCCRDQKPSPCGKADIPSAPCGT